MRSKKWWNQAKSGKSAKNENLRFSKSKKSMMKKIFFDRIFFKPQVLYQSCSTHLGTSSDSNIALFERRLREIVAQIQESVRNPVLRAWRGYPEQWAGITFNLSTIITKIAPQDVWCRCRCPARVRAMSASGREGISSTSAGCSPRTKQVRRCSVIYQFSRFLNPSESVFSASQNLGFPENFPKYTNLA